MTNEQLYLAIGIPSVINIGLISLLYLALSRQIETSITSLRNEMNARLDSLKSDIARVEGVLGAKIDALTLRVKALEDESRSPLVKR